MPYTLVHRPEHSLPGSRPPDAHITIFFAFPRLTDPSGQPLSDPTASNDPELFVLPMPGRATPGDQYRIRLSYFAPLDFEEGSYLMRLPTELPMGMVPQVRYSFYLCYIHCAPYLFEDYDYYIVLKY